MASWAFRAPEGFPEPGKIVSFAACWDQGQDPLTVFQATLKKGEQPPEDIPFGGLPLGPKTLPLRHSKRIRRWVDEHGTQILLAPNRPVDAWGRLLRWLARQKLVLHHAKFDLHHLTAGLRGCEGLPPEQGGGLDLLDQVRYDTQLTQFVLDPRNGSALKPTAVRLGLGKELGLDAGTEDEEQQALKPWKGPQTDPRFDLIPWRYLKPYAEMDAALTLILHEYQQDLFDEEVLYRFERRHARREFALAKTLYRMEQRGVGYDVEGSRQQAHVASGLMYDVATKLPFKPTYPGAQKFFFGSPQDSDGNPTGNLGHLPYDDKKTAGGKPQVDEETIDRLVAEGVPHATEFARYAELQSANSKWYQAWADLTGADGRLRTSHKQTAVISGRLSVQRAQLQAIPHGYQIPQGLRPVRELFRPKPGHQLWEVDVSQAEIRIATAIARCQPMLDLFNAGQDSHSAACWLMFVNEFVTDGFDTIEKASGLPPAAGGGVASPAHPKWNEYRQVAKRCNLGILYGAGAATVRQQILKFTGIDYPLGQVRGWVNDWRAAFPQFVDMLNAATSKATQDGCVRLINGRLRWFSAYEPTHKAANQVIQGSQAEVIKDALVRVERELPDQVILCIHDSIVIEPPTDRAERSAKRVASILVEEFERSFTKAWRPGGPEITVPFKADIKQWGS